MTSPDIPTPETDAEEYFMNDIDGVTHSVVNSDFARDLERRLDRLKVELEQVKKERSEAEYDLQMTQVMAEANITTAGRERREAKEWADKCEASQRAWQENHAKALREVDFVRTKNEELEAWARELIEERNKLSTELAAATARAEEAETRLFDQVEALRSMTGATETETPMFKARALLSELDRLRKEREWQPIETAPKDGTKVLIREEQHGRAVASWDWGYGWCSYANTYPLATHWMPLPDAPKQEEGEA